MEARLGPRDARPARLLRRLLLTIAPRERRRLLLLRVDRLGRRGRRRRARLGLLLLLEGDLHVRVHVRVHVHVHVRVHLYVRVWCVQCGLLPSSSAVRGHSEGSVLYVCGLCAVHVCDACVQCA